MYKNNSRFNIKFKSCSPLQLSCNLTGMKSAIGYYSYTNRCAAYKKEPTHKQHIWFLPTQKPTLKKPKELFFANARNEIKKEETEI